MKTSPLKIVVTCTLIGFALWAGLRALDLLTLRWINRQYPPMSTELAQANAVRDSWASLSRMTAANAVFRISSGTLDPLVRNAVTVARTSQPVKLADITTRLETQRIAFQANFAGTFQEIGIEATGMAWGSVSVSVSDSGLVLTPTLDRLQLASIRGKGWRLPAAVARATGRAIARFMANINSQIKPIAVPIFQPIAASQTLVLGSRTVVIPALAVTAASILIDDNRLVWLAQINGPKPTAAMAGSTAGTGFEAFKQAFSTLGGSLLSHAPRDGLTVDPDMTRSLFGNSGFMSDARQRSELSLSAAWQSASQLSGPDFALTLPASVLKPIVQPMLLEGLRSAAARAKIAVDDVTVSVLPGRISVSADATADLRQPVRGNVQFHVVVDAAPITDDARVGLLPSLDEVKIVRLESQDLDPVALVRAVNVVLTGLAAGLSQALPMIPFDLKPLTLPETDLAAAASKVPGLELAPAKLPASELLVSRAAILITPAGIDILADLSTNTPSLAARAPGTVEGPFPGVDHPERIAKLFADRRKATLGVADPTTISAAVSWKRLAEIVNARWHDIGDIHALYHFDSGTRPFDPVSIELVNKPTYTCSMGRHCSFNSCADSCQRDSCDWHCGLCADVPCPTWSHPLRTCQKCSPDPVCETSKAACQAGREPKFQACRALCDVKANADKGICDAQANLEKAGCDVGKAIQDAASHVGGIGRIGGDARVHGTLRTEGVSLELTPDHPGVRFAPNISAGLSVDGGIEFTPYDIGHVLVCPVKGRAPFSTNVVVPPQTPTIAVSLAATAQPEPSSLALAASIAGFELSAHVNPSPAEAIITQNPQLLIECNPVLGGAIAGLTVLGKATALSGDDLLRAVAGKDIAAVFSGQVDYSAEGFQIPINLKTTGFSFASQHWDLIPRLTDTAIALSVANSK